MLQAVKQAGYDVAQFNMACVGLPSMPETIAPSIAKEIATASSTSGVTIAAVSGTYNMIHPDPAIRADGLARLATIIRAAPLMGTRLVTLCTGTRDPRDQWKHHPGNSSSEAWRDLLEEMGKALVLAGEYDVDLGIEPELDAIGFVIGLQRRRQLVADRSDHGSRERFDDGDVASALGRRSCDFAADKACADNDNFGSWCQCRAQAKRIVDRSDDVAAGFATCECEPPWCETGRDRQRVVGNLTPARERDDLACQIGRLSGRTQVPRDVGERGPD